MLFISLLRVFTKNFESIWLIPPEFNTASWKTKVLTSALFPNAFRTVLSPFYTCNFCCDFYCNFLLVMHVNERMSYECSEYMYPHLNIHNLSTRSHASEEENRTYLKSQQKLQVWTNLYTQNLVKNYWLRLRRNFLPDINNWLKVAFILSFDFWSNAWWYKMVNFN
jgi:hypothetical protein